MTGAFGAATMVRRCTGAFSGGGAKAAYQFAVIETLVNEGGFSFDDAFGTSAGALHSLMVAIGELGTLRRIWLTVRADQVFRRYSTPEVALRVLRGKDGIYHNQPLRQLIREAAEGKRLRVPCYVGRTNMDTGEWELVGRAAGERADAEFCDAVWHSATMPVLWETIRGHDAQGREWQYADGGVRNVTPLGDALRLGRCNEVVVILCNPLDHTTQPLPAKRHVWDTALRAVEILETEVGRTDVEGFLRINDLVRQATAAGVKLRRPDGNPYKYVPITLIAPSESLGSSTDFSDIWREKRMRLGQADARAAVATPEAA